MATAEFSKFAGILRAALSQHHLLGFEIAQLEFHPVAHHFAHMLNRHVDDQHINTATEKVLTCIFLSGFHT